jgi:hypothetical protein
VENEAVGVQRKERAMHAESLQRLRKQLETRRTRLLEAGGEDFYPKVKRLWPLLHGHLGFEDDHATDAAEWLVHDALHASCQEMLRRGKPDGGFR